MNCIDLASIYCDLGHKPGEQTGNSPPPEFSKTCLVVRLQSFCPPPPKISAACGPIVIAFVQYFPKSRWLNSTRGSVLETHRDIYRSGFHLTNVLGFDYFPKCIFLKLPRNIRKIDVLFLIDVYTFNVGATILCVYITSLIWLYGEQLLTLLLQVGLVSTTTLR